MNSNTRRAVKRLSFNIARCVVAPLGLFGRMNEAAFLGFAQTFALIPGLIGDFLRRGYYYWTLEQCGPEVSIGWGSHFTKRDCRIEPRVTIGPNCIIGRAHIGEGTLVGSGVSIVSGLRQHVRREDGSLELGEFQQTRVGRNVWIGEKACIGAVVGDGAVVGMGAVVVAPVPEFCKVAGNPAVVIGKTG